MERETFVSVVVATYGRQDTLEATLGDLKAQNYEPFEIIVVDQNANPAAIDGVTVLPLAKPHLCVARNTGILAAKGEIVVFIDDDVRLEPGFLAAHVASYGAPELAGVGGWIDADRADRVWRPTDDYVASPVGCNMSFRRSALSSVGGFDTFMHPKATFGDEKELAHRVRRAGWKIRASRDARLRHLAHGSGGLRPGDHDYWAGYVANQAHVFWKTRRLREPLLVPWGVKLYGTVRRISGDALGPLATVRALGEGVRSARASLGANSYLDSCRLAQPL